MDARLEVPPGRRSALLPATLVMILLGLFCWLTLAAAAPSVGTAGESHAAALRVGPTPGADQDLVNYYVVGDGVDGQREYLFAIAERTLGDGRRYIEIFELNRGRRQPDGGALTDPGVLSPGWLLILPADAAGAGVKVGRRSSLTATELAPPLAVNGTQPDTDSASDSAVRGIALVGIVGLLALALRLLRRGTRLTLSRAERQPDALTAPAAAPVVVGAAPSPVDARRATTGRAEPARAPDRPPAPNRLAAERRPAGLDLGDRRLAGATGSPVEPQPPIGAPDAAIPEPAILEPAILESRLTDLHTRVVIGDAMLTIRLNGERGPRRTPGHGWIQTGEARPSGGAVLTVGKAPEGELWLDLAACPDVVTVTGSHPACLVQVRSWASQLGAAGVAVVVILDVPEAALPTGCRAVPTLEDLVAEQPPTDGSIEVVFCAAHDAVDPILRARLLNSTSPRRILVLVGQVRRSRWSISVAAPPRQS